MNSDIDIGKASRKLSQLDLKFEVGSFDIEMFWLRAMALDKDWRIGRHTHSAYEFHFVVEGESIVKTDVSEFKVEKGQFYITRPSEYHEQCNVNHKRYVEYSMNCSIILNNNQSKEQVLIHEILSQSICKPYTDNNGITDLFNKILSCAYYGKIGYYTEIQHYILMIIIACVQVVSENTLHNYQVALKHKKDDFRFKEITNYIKDNIHGLIATKDIATYMYLSEKQISRIIKKETGISTKQYINKLKLKSAKDLLKNTNYSIKEISDILGFSSEYYFNQFFKREEGYPPGLFRSNTINV